MEDPGHDEAGRQVDRGVDDAPAQLVQMLHQAHAGKFCALADRGPRLAYCVRGINHADLQSPRDGVGDAMDGFGSASGAGFVAGLTSAAGDSALNPPFAPGRAALTCSPVQGG